MPLKLTTPLKRLKGLKENQFTVITATLKVEGRYDGFPDLYIEEEIDFSLFDKVTDRQMRGIFELYCLVTAEPLCEEELAQLIKDPVLPDGIGETLNANVTLSKLKQTIKRKTNG